LKSPPSLLLAAFVAVVGACQNGGDWNLLEVAEPPFSIDGGKESCESPTTWWPDCDGDGFLAPSMDIRSRCEMPLDTPRDCLGLGDTALWAEVPPQGPAATDDCSDDTGMAYPAQEECFAPSFVSELGVAGLDYNCDGASVPCLTVLASLQVTCDDTCPFGATALPRTPRVASKKKPEARPVSDRVVTRRPIPRVRSASYLATPLAWGELLAFGSALGFHLALVPGLGLPLSLAPFHLCRSSVVSATHVRRCVAQWLSPVNSKHWPGPAPTS